MSDVPTCKHCNRPYADARGCIPHLSDNDAALVPYGEEQQALSTSLECRDCGTSKGMLHHSGCAMEECSLCQQQRLLFANVECDEVRAWATGRTS